MKLIKLNYDWMLLDVSIPAAILNATVEQQHQHAPDGKTLHVLTIVGETSFHYKACAYTYVDHGMIAQDDENYQEDIQLLEAHYSSMFGNS